MHCCCSASYGVECTCDDDVSRIVDCNLRSIHATDGSWLTAPSRCRHQTMCLRKVAASWLTRSGGWEPYNRKMPAASLRFCPWQLQPRNPEVIKVVLSIYPIIILLLFSGGRILVLQCNVIYQRQNHSPSSELSPQGTYLQQQQQSFQLLNDNNSQQNYLWPQQLHCRKLQNLSNHNNLRMRHTTTETIILSEYLGKRSTGRRFTM